MRIQNEAKSNKITYLDGRAPKDKVEDYSYYLDIQIYSMADCVGQNETIQYLEDKIKQLKKMQGGGK